MFVLAPVTKILITTSSNDIAKDFAILIGTSGALGMRGRQSKFDGVIAYLSTLPIMIPEIILGMVFLGVFSFMNLPFGISTS